MFQTDVLGGRPIGRENSAAPGTLRRLARLYNVFFLCVGRRQRTSRTKFCHEEHEDHEESRRSPVGLRSRRVPPSADGDRTVPCGLCALCGKERLTMFVEPGGYRVAAGL